MEKAPSAHKAKIVQRVNEALELSLCAANLLDPRFLGKKLKPSQVKKAQRFILETTGRVDNDHNKLMALKESFTMDLCKDVIYPRSWWRQGLRRFGFPDGLSSLAMDFTSIVCSLASLERVFSTLGTTYGTQRTSLGVDKEMKLAFLHNCLNR